MSSMKLDAGIFAKHLFHFRANMFVEDAVSAQGPIVVEVNPTSTVAELKLQIEKEFEIPVDVQKWILGKNLVTEDALTLQSQGIIMDGAEIFLYLVNPGEDTLFKIIQWKVKFP